METSVGHGLATYLNDHLAGSAAGLQLARRCRDREGDTVFGRHLLELVDQIEEDRAELDRVMQRVGATPNPVKRWSALAAEHAWRLKQTLPTIGAGSAATARLQDVELLSIGIEGKLLLWRVLGTLTGFEELRGFDFPSLEERALDQRRMLERFRLEIAAGALAR
jgi:hypothetical protein